MWYLITLFIFVVLYIIGIIMLKYIDKNRIINILVPVIIFVLYIYCLIKIYIKSGINDWNFTNALPTANISPFMYCACLIIAILPFKINKYGNTLISFLSLGMVIAGAFNLVFNASRNYNFYLHFVVDSFIHMLLSWYGLYLFKTKQVVNKLNEQIISSLLIIGVAVVMLIINTIFKTNFFGLSMYGNHNIYNIVICESSIISALLYFLGLIIVMFSGWIFQNIINKKELRFKYNRNSNRAEII